MRYVDPYADTEIGTEEVTETEKHYAAMWATVKVLETKVPFDRPIETPNDLAGAFQMLCELNAKKKLDVKDGEVIACYQYYKKQELPRTLWEQIKQKIHFDEFLTLFKKMEPSESFA